MKVAKLGTRNFRTSIIVFLLLSACAKGGPRLSALGVPPDWQRLEAYQETLTRREFLSLLNGVYGDAADTEQFFRLETDGVSTPKTAGGRERFLLRFAASPQAKRTSPEHTWRERPVQNPSPEHPLAGLRVALDPGHLGGPWARMEYRWFLPKGGDPVAEGDLTLLVAEKLAGRLQDLGAEVILLRRDATPATPLRPEDLRDKAEKYLDSGQNLNLESPESFRLLPRDEQIRQISELLFYRVAEIRARADLVNQTFHPDLTLCLHFNAMDWGNPEAPKPASKNHLHVLIPGAVQAEEWALDDIRFETLKRLLDGSHGIEQALAETLARNLARSTGLPPALAPGGAVKKVGNNPYVWARNLLANRLDEGPVLFIEAYVMNYPEVIARIRAGDYEGMRKIRGHPFASLYRDYADGLAEGLLEYYHGASSQITR